MQGVELIKNRRSRYALSARIPISEGELEKILQGCIKYAPSAFNSQTARVVLLLSSAHKLLWDLTLEALRPLVPADRFAPTKQKIKTFAQAYGTILDYEDQTAVKELEKEYNKSFLFFSRHVYETGLITCLLFLALNIKSDRCRRK